MKNKKLTILILIALILSLMLLPILSGCNNKVIVLKV